MFLPLPIISVVVEPLGFEKCCIYTIVVEEKKCYYYYASLSRLAY